MLLCYFFLCFMILFFVSSFCARFLYLFNTLRICLSDFFLSSCQRKHLASLPPSLAAHAPHTASYDFTWNSCLARWDDKFDTTADHAHSKDPRQSPHSQECCPICDEDTPALGDPRLDRRRRYRRRPRNRHIGESFGLRWPGARKPRGSGSTSSSFGHTGAGTVDLRFAPTSSSLQSPPPPPSKSPPPPGGTPDGIPLTAVGAEAAAAAAAGAVRGSHRGPPRPPPPPPTPPLPPVGLGLGLGLGDHAASMMGTGAATGGEARRRPFGGEEARERARREAAFRLASLGSQYPRFLDERVANR